MSTPAFINANGLKFAYLEEGEGPLVLLVHGFPDSAHTWDATRPALAQAGFRAVSSRAVARVVELMRRPAGALTARRPRSSTRLGSPCR